MKLIIIALVLCVSAWLSAGDVAHFKSAKTKLLGRIVRAKHHKRGVLSAIPPYKLGYDIPVVTHSVVKPVVVSYPPAAAVTAVKVPLANPLATRYPVPVGHRVPVPHPHYGLKFPHHYHTKTVLVPEPENHFHHHHHHVEPNPHVHVPAAVPVPATPLVPIEPTVTVHAHPVPVPSPPVLFQPQPIPAPTAEVPAPAFAPTSQFVPQENIHFRPVAPAPVPIGPAPTLAPLTPLLPIQSHFPYVLRHGNALQTSYFANYPRYPLLHYQSPFYPLAQAAAPPAHQVFFEQPQIPHLQPHLHLHQDGVVNEQPSVHGDIQPDTLLHSHPNVPHIHLQSTQPTLHLQPTQSSVHLHPTQTAVHLQPDVHHPQPEIPYHSGQPEIHFHSGQPGLLQPTQPTLHGQPTVHVQPTQPSIHQVPLEHDGWSPVQPTPHDIAVSQGAHFGQDANFGHGTQFGQGGQFGQGNQYDQGNHFGQAGQFGQDGNFGQSGHHQFTQEHGTQVYEHHTGDEQFNFQNELQHHIQQQLDQAQYDQIFNNQQHQQANVPHDSYGAPLNKDYGEPNQDIGHSSQSFGQGDFNQHGQDFGHGQNFNQPPPAAEYGVPQNAEGRSSEGEDEYHNHIPLKLQPPLEKELEHFRR